MPLPKSAFSDLESAVKDACPPRVWVLGGRLADEGKVELTVNRGRDELEFRVWAPGRPVAPTVSLFVGDEEWDCDCPSRSECCEHVVAALRFVTSPAASPAAEEASAGPRLHYELRPRRGGLVLERSWQRADGSQKPVDEPLSRFRKGVQGSYSPRESDLKIEQLLVATEGKILPLETLPSLFEWLADSESVSYGEEEVAVSAEALGPRAKLRKEGEAFVLTIEAPAGEPQVIADGVVKLGKRIHALTHLRLVGARLEHTPRVRRFEGEDVVELLTELLPQLRKGTQLDLGELELPRIVDDCPVEAQVEVRVQGDRLQLAGAIIYGPADDPWARIELDRLVHLQGPLPRRRPQAETRAQARLRSRFDIEIGEIRQYRGDEAAQMAERLRRYDGPIRGRRQLERFGRALELRIQREGDRLDLDFTAGEASVEAERVLDAWRAGESGIALKGGGWAALPRELLAEHGERLVDFLMARGSRGELPTHAVGTVAPLLEAMEMPLPPRFESLRALIGDFRGIPRAEAPEDLQATLRPYQQSGVDWLRFLSGAGLGAMLCDDMGLGKTLQALTALETPALVVAPTSLLHNWRLEAERFRPGLKVRVHHGPNRQLGTPDPDEIVVTSYGVMRLDIDELAAQRWSTLVLDEAQTIKNPDSQVARAAFELQADFRMTLSGTPVENRLDELWSQAHLTNPGLLGGRNDFKERYARPIAAGHAGLAEQLRNKIGPFLLRRLKADVAPELPPRTEITVHCMLDEEERALYEALRGDVRAQVEGMLADGKGVLSALEALLRLRQAACHRALVPGQNAADSAKLRRLRADLDMAVAAGHRALVFSQWTSLLDLVSPALREMGIEHLRLDGSTRDRQGLVDAFQDPQGPPVMLLSLMAGGTGLNLTAADHVYFLDPWWNPAVEAQAADRAHRIGQDRPVIVHRLVARDTVDERILALQERKRALAESVVAEGGGALTREDLLELLA